MAFDPDEFLKSEKDKEEATVNNAPSSTAFNPDEFLRTESAPVIAAPTVATQGPVVPEESLAVGSVAPAITGYGYAGPTGITEVVKDIAQASTPLYEAGKQALQGYARSPGKAIVDVGAAHLGIPPPYATTEAVKGVYNTYKGAIETGKNLSDVLGKLPAGTEKVAEPFARALRPNDFQKFMEVVNKDGLETAFKTYKAPAYLGEEALASLNATKSAFPSMAAKIGSVAMPFVRGAARVAGPVGLGMNIYDAAQFVQQADLGGRLARGEAQLAPQAYRGLLNQNVSQYQPSPAEAKNLLDSNDERTINIYGGRKKLQDLVQQETAQKIRDFAASKVLGNVSGPVRPGAY